MYKFISVVAFLIVAGCNPRIEVATPEKPIEINLNVKIDHELYVKMDKEVENLVQNDELF